MENYTFVRVSDGNLHHLQALYTFAFNIKVPVTFFKKKFDTGRFGSRWLGFLALDDKEQPAAYYGVFPCVCVYEGAEILVAQSGDTMTHPDHRGKGLFTELAKKTYDLCRESGVAFIFGFPNASSYPGFIRKLAWKHEADMDFIEARVPTLPLVKLAKKFSFVDVFYRAYHRVFFTSRLVNEALQNSWLLMGYNGISHDRRFFNYKAYNRSYVALFAGKKVWFKVDGRLWIGDIEPCTKEEFARVFTQLRRLAFFLGCTGICSHLEQQSPFHPWLSEKGRVLSKNPIGYLDLESGLDFNRIKFVSADFDTF